MTRAFLFDMDGLLVDTEALHLSTFAALARELGVPCRTEDLHVWIGKGQNRLAAWIVEEAGRGDPEEVVRAQRKAFLEALEREDPEPQPGVAELLGEARCLGIPVGLVSNSDGVFVRATMARVLPHLGAPPEPEGTFQVVVTRDHVAHPKPAPDPYLLACSRLRVEPAASLVFEDSPSGIRAARAAGCPVVTVPCPYLADREAVAALADRAFASLLEAHEARVWESGVLARPGSGAQ